jgi:hypothetical protein
MQSMSDIHARQDAFRDKALGEISAIEVALRS